MAEQLRVFVSHSHQDNAFCHAIVQALRDASADVWYDEHNLGWGELHDVIQREMGRRPIFILILSKAVFASKWVKRETKWAYKLYDRDPTRVILPVTAGQIEASDFDPETGWLFLDDFKRIEAPGYQPYPADETATRLLRALNLTPAGEVPAPAAPQPTEDVDDLLNRGRALMAQQQYADALPLFVRATQLAPGSLGAWVNLGRVYIGLRHWQEALEACDRALDLDPTLAVAWNNKGYALGDLDSHEEALAAYDRALDLDPNDAKAWGNKGAALIRLSRYEEALAAYDQALALDPNHATTWRTVGILLSIVGRSEEALAAYDQALALDPNDRWIWSLKGTALHGLGRTDEAEEAEQRARDLGMPGPEDL